ncbi:twin-arginine translocation signal domain-containing protein [Marinobacter hydrocarbonoclasticus]|nr:twin-arginine translocation signal domain-containing protein [Marinobacter nauticus]
MNDRQTRLDRRRALKALGLGAGAVALSSGAVQAQTSPTEAKPVTKPSGYRESPHVLAYYASLRK